MMPFEKGKGKLEVKGKVVYGYNNVAGDLDDDEPLASGTGATHFIQLNPTNVVAFILKKVHWRLENTNPVTHELILLEASEATALVERRKVAYASGAGKAEDTDYIETGAGTKLPVVVKLDDAGKLYFKIDYSGAPSTTAGFIKVEGEVLA